MSMIEWCDITLNPVVGCSKCSPGCEHCYAEKFAARLAKNPATAEKYADVVDEKGWTGHFSQPSLAMFRTLPKSPRRIFVGSMTDIFHDEIVKGGKYHKTWLPMLFDAMLSLPQHTFMLLTKRPENMKAWIDFTLEHCVDAPLPNVWLGVTVCNQAEAEEKLSVLMDIPAAKRFVSVEPMLEPVDLGKWLPDCYECGACGTRMGRHESPALGCENCAFCGEDTYEVWGDGPSPVCPECGSENAGPICPDCGFDMLIEGLTTISLDWIICGAETGPGARPMNLAWARNLRDQCAAANIPFFFKKAGNRKPVPDDLMVREFPEALDHW